MAEVFLVFFDRINIVSRNIITIGIYLFIAYHNQKYISYNNALFKVCSYVLKGLLRTDA